MQVSGELDSITRVTHCILHVLVVGGFSFCVHGDGECVLFHEIPNSFPLLLLSM